MMVRFEDNFKFLAESPGLIGRDEEKSEVVYRIDSGNMLLIEGKKGVGKTALLKYAIDKFKGFGRVVYIDVGSFGKRLDITSLLQGRPNGMILLIDNIEYLSESNNKKIKYFYDQDRIKSVVFTTADLKTVAFTDAIRSRIGRNIIKLKALSKEDALRVARDRLDLHVSISDKVLDELYKVSGNLKEFLFNCDSLYEYLEKENKHEAEISDVKKVAFELELDEEDVQTCLECNGSLIEVNGNWRCKNCDDYCDNCGALTDEDECPFCGAEVLEVGDE